MFSAQTSPDSHPPVTGGVRFGPPLGLPAGRLALWGLRPPRRDVTRSSRRTRAKVTPESPTRFDESPELRRGPEWRASRRRVSCDGIRGPIKAPQPRFAFPSRTFMSTFRVLTVPIIFVAWNTCGLEKPPAWGWYGNR